jgi:hypothetical protein
MYIFLLFIVVALVALVTVLTRENKRVTKLNQEKAEGKWDYIDNEYLPYLKSHNNAITRIEKLEFKINYRSYSWSLSGAINYNAAGVYIEFDEMRMLNTPKFVFIWGKEKPSRFSPGASLYFHSLGKEKDSVKLFLKTKANLTSSDYSITIKNAPDHLISELNAIFN